MYFRPAKSLSQWKTPSTLTAVGVGHSITAKCSCNLLLHINSLCFFSLLVATGRRRQPFQCKLCTLLDLGSAGSKPDSPEKLNPHAADFPQLPSVSTWWQEVPCNIAQKTQINEAICCVVSWFSMQRMARGGKLSHHLPGETVGNSH